MNLDVLNRLWNWHWFRILLVVLVVGGSASLALIVGLQLNADQQEKDAGQATSSAYLILGVAAFIASLVALFGNAVIEWIWRPVLTVDYVHSRGYCDTPELRGGGQAIGANCYYFSLRVANKGTKSALDVEVFATDLRRWSDENKTWSLVRRYSMGLKWAWLGVTRLPKLAPSMDRFCNIGHIIDPAQRSNFAQDNEVLPGVAEQIAILSLDLEARPNHGIHLLEPGKYQLTIWVAAANHKPIQRNVTIDLSETWHAEIEKMLSEGIRIELS